MSEAKFEDLVGQVIESAEGLGVGSECIYFNMASGRRYQMFHPQDCCERVQLEDIAGDVSDLMGSPILQAEESSNSDVLEGKPEHPESFTWTFYRISTAKGLVVLRWLGESNGYYGESVNFSYAD